jgi:hypothetical protein
LCRLRRRLYCWKNSPKMVCALQARQFWHEWHSALGAASGGIYRGLSIMTCFRGTWPSLLNDIVNNFAVWIKQPAKTPGSTTWSDYSAWQRPTPHCKHDESDHSGTRLGDSSTSVLLSGPCPIGLPPLSLSL